MTHLVASLGFVSPVSTLADAIGIVGIVLGASWALLARRSAILLCQALGALAFATHFLLLGSLDGALMCLAGAAQGCAARAELRRGALISCYALTAAVAGAATFATTSGVPPLFAALGLAFATFGRLQTDAQHMRWTFLASSCAWAVHNFMVGSLVGNASDALTAAGILIGLWTHHRREHGAKSPAFFPLIGGTSRRRRKCRAAPAVARVRGHRLRRAPQAYAAAAQRARHCGKRG